MTEDLKSNDRSNLTCIDGALLSLRIASGLAFLYHGGAILFGLFGGPDRDALRLITDIPSFSAIWSDWRR